MKFFMLSISFFCLIVGLLSAPLAFSAPSSKQVTLKLRLSLYNPAEYNEFAGSISGVFQVSEDGADPKVIFGKLSFPAKLNTLTYQDGKPFLCFNLKSNDMASLLKNANNAFFRGRGFKYTLNQSIDHLLTSKDEDHNICITYRRYISAGMRERLGTGQNYSINGRGNLKYYIYAADDYEGNIDYFLKEQEYGIYWR